MKKIETQIEINAPIQKVWAVFSDFSGHSDWNPFLIKLEGALKEGQPIEVTVKLGNIIRKGRPILDKLVEGREVLFVTKKSFLFKGEHYFRFEELPNNRTQIIHGERFYGLIPFLKWKKFKKTFEKAFQEMNSALKHQAELPPSS